MFVIKVKGKKAGKAAVQLAQRRVNTWGPREAEYLRAFTNRNSERGWS